VLLAALLSAGSAGLLAYPLDGYDETGIRRVEGSRLANEGRALGGRQPPGALLTTAEVDIRLADRPALQIPPPDPGFTGQVKALLGEHVDDYGIAVLDLTDPDRPAYAEHCGDYLQNVGSVGKLVGALGYFQALADAWPDDPEARKRVLHDTSITADDFSRSDGHDVRFFDVERRILTRRPLQSGDEGSVWEYLDWMLSASSNAAASMIMRDAMLLRRFGRKYPVPEDRIRAFFGDTPAGELTQLFRETFWEPVARNGLDLSQIRQGSFFTAQGKRNVNGGGTSYATAHSLVQLMLLMEQGRLVDAWSSRQIKRLLYVTERRIRYASSPALNNAAVYYKSGSWYRCREEEGFRCGRYRGNVINYMNSVAIVEQEIGGRKLHYIVAVISNVLRRNSAVDHQELGTEIHQLIERRNGLEVQ
jgi:hypothetical protein